MYRRRSIRLQDYDYTQNGAYFVTICSHRHLCIFGNVADGEMILNTWVKVVQSCWDEIPKHYPMVELDVFVVMPNHVHGVIAITSDDYETSERPVGAQYIAPLQQPHPKGGATPTNVPSNSLGAIVRTFKAAVTRRINHLPTPPEHPIWQRNYYEHIIRNDASMKAIQQYIVYNPTKWTEDSLYVGTR